MSAVLFMLLNNSDLEIGEKLVMAKTNIPRYSVINNNDTNNFYIYTGRYINLYMLDYIDIFKSAFLNKVP